MMIELNGQNFGRNIAYLRKKYAISYRSLGMLCGMDPNILHGIEKGTNYPIITTRSLCRLCQIFDLTAEELSSPLPEAQ